MSFQVALSLLLLAGTGLLVRTLANLRHLDPGMTRENLLLVDTNISQLGYQPQRSSARNRPSAGGSARARSGTRPG